jgi:hypothetical protein
MAWLFGLGMVTWRWKKAGAPPTPGSLALASGAFALAALLGTYPPARGAAALFAVGLDVAAVLKVLPGSTVKHDQNWPPSMITDSSVLLPDGKAQPAAGSNPANSAVPPAGTPAPGGGATAPANPGTPPTGPGTIYPPGSQNL